MTEPGRPDDDPLWYKDAIIYEIPVRAFFDTKGDGVGDFRGLTRKLDHLEELGVTALWLLPFYPSPLRDDGYDISDYTDVDARYGTLRDFRAFLREAHRRGLRVIIELVLNHTSDRHPWFQRARGAKPGTPWRDFYVWSDTPDRYRDARIIFKDFEVSNWTWDPMAKAYYFHRFYSHQPDLNYDNPRVRNAIRDVVDFWLGLGVDGLRLDAIPYLYEREGTSCENLPETHAFLKELRRHVLEEFPNRVLLAEANQWPEDAAAYFGDGDEAHLAFHFPLMPRLFMALRMEDRFPILEILSQTPAIPPAAQWALFLRNHDELTLEMVTDEERDYIYRMYARDPQAKINLGIRRRLAPLLENDRRKVELMLGLLLSLPGTPVLYYGDEIGMGDNFYLGDRHGVRTPMQWSADKNAGFSTANPQKLYSPVIIDPAYHYETVNVETQRANPHSLLSWTRRLIGWRRRHPAFGRGTIEFLYPENRKILAFVRRNGEEAIVVVANLSRHAQPAELDLRSFAGATLEEVGGGTRFPSVGAHPYVVTLGPYGFYWLVVKAAAEGRAAGPPIPRDPPQLTLRAGWRTLFREGLSAAEQPLMDYLPRCRWFPAKARAIRSVSVEDAVPVTDLRGEIVVAFLRVEYEDGESEGYVLPVGFAREDSPSPAGGPDAIIARITGGKGRGILYDASRDPRFLRALLAAAVRHRRWKGLRGEVTCATTTALRSVAGTDWDALEGAPLRVEPTNLVAGFGDRLFLKMYRRFDLGPSPEFEFGRHLTERVRFPHAPALVAGLQYGLPRTPPGTFAIITQYVRNEGDAWEYTLDVLGHFYERATSDPTALSKADPPGKHLLDFSEAEPPPTIQEVIGPYLEQASLIGRRTADLHRASASAADDPDFAPEPFDSSHQKAMYHARITLTDQVYALLRRTAPLLPVPAQPVANRALELEKEIRKRFRAVRDRTAETVRIRCHGDYHLGQLLYTGKDFAIIDFEGDPRRSLTERRLKRSPLRDVAGMVRSFHYASLAGLDAHAAASPDLWARLEPWARHWYVWVASRFLGAYRDGVGSLGFLPSRREDLQALLDAYLLERAIHEVGHELQNRPSWASIPLRGILELLS